MHEQGSYEDHRQWIEAMVMTGESLETVEADIADSPLGEEQKDALWLFAWSMSDRRRPDAQQKFRRGRQTFVNK